MTGLELQQRVLQRLGDDPGGDPARMYYRPSGVLATLNQVQRLFVLLTLCLETTASFTSGAGTFYRMLTYFGDWLLPLRIRLAGGAKLRPARIHDLAALDNTWTARAGMPSRYAHLGFDLMAFYKQGVASMEITYARGVVDLVAGGTPEIPAEYHPALIDGAIPLLRLKEGQQEWQKVLPLWDRFLDAAEECAAGVRARNLAYGYDRMPCELKRFDRSKLLQKQAV